MNDNDKKQAVHRHGSGTLRPDDDHNLQLQASGRDKKTKNHTVRTKPTNRTRITFPSTLHRILQDSDKIPDVTLVDDVLLTVPLNSIIKWLPHGRAFVILDKDKFERIVMPFYFQGQKDYASFQRQLNLYNFCRVHKSSLFCSNDQECEKKVKGYFHYDFLRNESKLASDMKRFKNEGKKPKCIEPNFESLPFIHVVASTSTVKVSTTALSAGLDLDENSISSSQWEYSEAIQGSELVPVILVPVLSTVQLVNEAVPNVVADSYSEGK